VSQIILSFLSLATLTFSLPPFLALLGRSFDDSCEIVLLQITKLERFRFDLSFDLGNELDCFLEFFGLYDGNAPSRILEGEQRRTISVPF